MGHVATTSSMLLLLTVGLATGYLVGRGDREATEQRSATVEMEALDRLSGALGELTAEVGRHSELCAAGRASDATDASAEVVAALVVSLPPLLESVSAASKNLEAIARLLARTQEPGSPLTVPVATVETEVFARLDSLSEVDRRLQLHAWSHQQVIDTYGAPTRIVLDREGTSERWYFKRPDLGEFVFQFNGDRLVHVTVP